MTHNTFTAHPVKAWRPEAVPAQFTNLILVRNDDGLHFAIRFHNLQFPIVEIHSFCHDFAVERDVGSYVHEEVILYYVQSTTFF